MLALRMQPPCGAAAGTFSEQEGQEGQENSWSAASMQHFSFMLVPAGDSLRGNCRQIFWLDPSLDQPEVTPSTFGSTSRCLAFRYAAGVPCLFFLITALPKYNDQ